MANKTTTTKASVTDFLNSIEPQEKRSDAFRLLELHKSITGLEPVMWGPSIIGFGQYHYKYDSGREGDFFRAGFSPRKQALTVYLIAGFEPFQELLDNLSKHKTGRSCLYIKKLTDVDINVLEELITKSYEYISKRYPT